MDNDLIQDTNLDLLQVNAVEVEYSGIAPINVDNQEHTISLDPSALSSKLDTSAFDEWTATHSAGEEYSAGEGIDITDHVISYTGDPGEATPWISGNKIITSADYMQPGEFIQVLSSFDLSGNKNHFITVKGQGYYFPTNQDLKERVGVDDYLPLSSFSSYTSTISQNLESNWNYTNSAYSQSLNNYYNKLDISAFSSWSSEHSGDYLTKESADTLYQPIGDYQTAGNYQTAGDYLSATDSALFYPMEGNPSGFLTGVDLSNYYEKNETSSKEEIENAITSVENIINNLSGEYYPLTSNPSGYLTAHQSLDDYQKTADMTAYQEVGDYYSASNPSGFITGVDLSNYYEKNETSSKEEISDALTGKLDATSFDPNAFYPSSNPSGFITGVDLTDYVERDDLTAYQEKGDYYSASNPSGFITGVDLSNYYDKNETSSKEEISAAFEEYSGIDDPYELSAGDGISIVNNTATKKTIITCTATAEPVDTGAFYPMTGNPSGFLTAHQSLTNYYTKNETSSKEQISAAITGKQDNLTFAYNSSDAISSINGSAIAGNNTNNLSAGEGISIVETADKVVISCTATGVEFDPTYMSAQIDNKLNKSESANYYPKTGNPSGFLTTHQSLSNYYRKNETSSKTEIANALQNAGHEYTGIAPIGVNNSTYQISAETWTLSAGEGLVLSEDSNAKVATISITGSTGCSNIHWYVDTPNEHTSADIDLTIQTTASLGGGYDRNLLDNNGNFIGALIPSAASEDLGKVLTITAGSPRWQNLPETPSGAYGIKTEVVANSGLATGQNILYIVTGN